MPVQFEFEFLSDIIYIRIEGKDNNGEFTAGMNLKKRQDGRYNITQIAPILKKHFFAFLPITIKNIRATCLRNNWILAVSFPAKEI